MAISVAECAELRTAVRELLSEKCTEADVRRVMASADGFDRELWRRLADQGVLGKLVDTDLGGLGFSFQALKHMADTAEPARRTVDGSGMGNPATGRGVQGHRASGCARFGAASAERHRLCAIRPPGPPGDCAGRPTRPAEFSVPGSGTEVAAKLIGGQAELGLIHLPASDKRLRHKVVASYQGAVAVRFDDPLAAKDLVTIDELRDREVAIDFARPNPVVLAGLTRRLNSRGVHRIVRTTNQRGGELELATQVFNRHLVALVSYAPDSFVGKMFSPPEFRLVPIDETNWAQRESHWPESPNAYRAGSPRSSRPSGRSPTGSGRYGEAPDLNRYPSVEAQAGAPSHPQYPRPAVRLPPATRGYQDVHDNAERECNAGIN